MKTFIRAFPAPWRSAVEILIGDRDGRTIVKEMVCVPQDEGVAALPSLTLTHEMAQALMDDLWNCGLRPTEGTGSAGAMRATERHLEDLRKLVFKESSKD